jgi:UDP-N-acetylmuramate dehydrogenase
MIKENISLKTFNTFGIDVRAKYVYEALSIPKLQEVLNDASYAKLPKLILGGGSNVLFTKDFDGIVIENRIPGIEKLSEDENHVWLEVGAGVIWHHLVEYCLQHNLAGIENLSLIPGTVGAAPMQNIGAYGIELEKVFERLTALKICDGSIHSFDHPACCFNYRESIFKTHLKNQYIICSVILRLNKNPTFHTDYGAIKQTLAEMNVTELSIKAISAAVVKIRSSKLPDPKIIGNAGSFFKNPLLQNTEFEKFRQQFPHASYFAAGSDQHKISAAWLIEQCGWKGYRKNDVGVHQHHSLILVNYGAASGKELKVLAENIQDSVKQKFNIELCTEVNIY